jgi:ribonuclease-3
LTADLDQGYDKDMQEVRPLDKEQQDKIMLERRFRKVTGGLNLTHQALSVALSSSRNQRLEFLGDSIIGQYLSYVLYFAFPGLDEGKMTKIKSYLASRRTQAKLTMANQLWQMSDEYVERSRRTPNVLSNLFEAAVGAVWVHLGQEAAENMIDVAYSNALKGIYDDWERITSDADPKSTLQEMCHRQYGSSPQYASENIDGAEFLVEIFVDKEGVKYCIGKGRGQNIRSAERIAARDAIETLQRLRRRPSDEVRFGGSVLRSRDERGRLGHP